MSIEVMKQALEALEKFAKGEASYIPVTALTNGLRLAIEQAEKQDALDRMADNSRELGLDYTPMQAEKQEPVAWTRTTWMGVEAKHEYTAPPQRQPLTEEEIESAYMAASCDYISVDDAQAFARAIERKHGIGGEHD